MARPASWGEGQLGVPGTEEESKPSPLAAPHSFSSTPPHAFPEHPRSFASLGRRCLLCWAPLHVASVPGKQGLRGRCPQSRSQRPNHKEENRIWGQQGPGAGLQ